MQRSTLIFLMAGAILMILNLPETKARMTLVQIKNAMKGAGKTCVGKSGVMPEILAETKKGIFPPDRALQCYYLCLLTQLKVTKNDRLVLATMLKQTDMLMPLDMVERSKEVTQMCYESSNAEDSCERSWQFTKCFWETDQSVYIFP